MSNDKALAAFVNIFEQPVIWAAFHERSFEVGERSEVGVLESTTTSLYARAEARINNKLTKYVRNFLS